ncbi:hypothetical protein [Nonomuraea rhizosphaerae]|uniref:hypothetical protein n=1 Tax=Nonomuraea rhizosphaerae TaxID=2665663 RepID=UPI001C5F7C25|nr:hypothetical protein [Nonomuraea rhizosphaerae]
MRSKLVTLTLATLAAGACILTTVASPAAASSASASSKSSAESQTGKRKWIDSRHGWQRSGVFVEAGDLVRVVQVDGRWTVDHRQFPYVSGRGYSWYTDRRINQGCKILDNYTYGTLVGKLNNTVFRIGSSAVFRANQDGFLELRVNDDDRCLGDNDGALRVKVSILDEG